MTYQIDQSGKIEQTHRPTVVCLANGKSITIKISAVEKQKLIRTIGTLQYPNRTYMYDIFAVLVYILLRQSSFSEVVIDKEYPGHEAGIKERLFQFFEKEKTPMPNISFGLVGKKCTAHMHGLETFQGKRKPTLIINANQVIEVLYKQTNKKSWRPRSSRGSP